MHTCQFYLECLFHKDKRDKAIAKYTKVVKQIQEKHGLYAIAVSGTSGILGAMIADWANLELIVVRGKETKTHSSYKAEGLFTKGNYVIFDDLIDSGETCWRIWKSIKDECTRLNEQGGVPNWDTCPVVYHKVAEPTLIGAVLYSSSILTNNVKAKHYMYSDQALADLPADMKVWTKELY